MRFKIDSGFLSTFRNRFRERNSNLCGKLRIPDYCKCSKIGCVTEIKIFAVNKIFQAMLYWNIWPFVSTQTVTWWVYQAFRITSWSYGTGKKACDFIQFQPRFGTQQRCHFAQVIIPNPQNFLVIDSY